MKNITSSLLLSTMLAFVIASPAMAASKHVNALGGKIKPLIGSAATGGIGLLGGPAFIGKSGILQFVNSNGKVRYATYTQTNTSEAPGQSDTITVTYKSGEKVQENILYSLDNGGIMQTETINFTGKNGVPIETKKVTIGEETVNGTTDVSESITVNNGPLHQFTGNAVTKGTGTGETIDLTLYNAKGKQEGLQINETTEGSNTNPTGFVLDTTGVNFGGKAVDTQVTETVTSE